MRLSIRYLLTSALVLPLVAQEETTRVTQEKPVLVLKTAEAELLFDAAHSFGHHGPVPDLAEGFHYVLSVDSDRVAEVSTRSGAVRFLELSVDPGGLMELFADEIGEVRGIVQGLGVMAMTQQGFKAKEAIKMLRAVFDFPYTLENATFVLLADPKAAPSVRDIVSFGLSIEVGITAKADSPLGRSLVLLKPTSVGVPMLPTSPDTLMDMRFSIDPEGMSALFEPFLEFGLSFSYTGEDARKHARKVWDDMMKLYDGGFAVAIAKNMEMEGLYGFLEPEALARLVGSEDYLEMMRMQQPGRDIEVEVETDVFEHRGAKFTRMTLYNDGMPNPMMPDGEMRSFFGGIGTYMILGGSEKRAKALADVVADGKIERAPLSGGAVLSLDMNLRGWLQAMRKSLPVNVKGDLDRMPKHLSLRVVPSGRTVTFKIEAK